MLVMRFFFKYILRAVHTMQFVSYDYLDWFSRQERSFEGLYTYVNMGPDSLVMPIAVLRLVYMINVFIDQTE